MRTPFSSLPLVCTLTLVFVGSLAAYEPQRARSSGPPQFEKKSGLFTKLFGRKPARVEEGDEDDDDDGDSRATGVGTARIYLPSPVSSVRVAALAPERRVRIQDDPRRIVVVPPVEQRQKLATRNAAPQPPTSVPASRVNVAPAQQVPTAQPELSLSRPDPGVSPAPTEPARTIAALDNSQSAMNAPSRPSTSASFPVPDSPTVSPGPPATPNAPAESVVSEAPPFGKPVPGRAGLVYTPGQPETPQNMVDIRGIEPGTKVRDPLTKTVFRVP